MHNCRADALNAHNSKRNDIRDYRKIKNACLVRIKRTFQHREKYVNAHKRPHKPEIAYHILLHVKKRLEKLNRRKAHAVCKHHYGDCKQSPDCSNNYKMNRLKNVLFQIERLVEQQETVAEKEQRHTRRKNRYQKEIEISLKRRLCKKILLYNQPMVNNHKKYRQCFQ